LDEEACWLCLYNSDKVTSDAAPIVTIAAEEDLTGVVEGVLEDWGAAED
jgi:hypothetical protein